MPTVPERLRALTAGIPQEEAALERSLLIGIVAFGWAAGIWAAVALGIDLANQPEAPPYDPTNLPLAHVVAAVTLVALALAYTGWSTITVRAASRRLLGSAALTAHGTIALALVLLDEWVYGPGNFHSQSLGSIWPFTWVFVMGLALAGRGGFGAGLAVGVTSWVGAVQFGSLAWSGDQKVGSIGTVVLYALGGGVVGFAAIKLREAEREIALARARDEVGRTLHDGVLQTLAVIQRRSTDDELIRLAREQETDLRSFLFGLGRDLARPSDVDLLTQLREVAALAERRHGIRVDVAVVAEPDRIDGTVATAVAGAVAEALTNAAKHGGAKHATVFIDETNAGRLFCSVKDDGAGFDPATVTEGQGLTGSIRARITEAGGTVRVASRPGAGTEVIIEM